MKVQLHSLSTYLIVGAILYPILRFLIPGTLDTSDIIFWFDIIPLTLMMVVSALLPEWLMDTALISWVLLIVTFAAFGALLGLVVYFIQKRVFRS